MLEKVRNTESADEQEHLSIDEDAEEYVRNLDDSDSKEIQLPEYDPTYNNDSYEEMDADALETSMNTFMGRDGIF